MSEELGISIRQGITVCLLASAVSIAIMIFAYCIVFMWNYNSKLASTQSVVSYYQIGSLTTSVYPLSGTILYTVLYDNYDLVRTFNIRFMDNQTSDDINVLKKCANRYFEFDYVYVQGFNVYDITLKEVPYK